jgi:hypothetical protein
MRFVMEKSAAMIKNAQLRIAIKEFAKAVIL